RYTREADWLPTVASVKNTYLPLLYNNANAAATIRKLQAQGLYPNTAPPDFAQHGGNVPIGYQLAITAAAGDIYYTLDGSDPREIFTSNAIGTLYSSPVALNQTATVKVRARNGSEWSALTEATFIVGTPASASTLAISELNYHPLLSEEHEFIELVNISAQTIDLTGVHFTAGVEFTFPLGLLLGPGERTLVVRNIAEFETQYGAGLPVAGAYVGSLENAGEEIALAAADGSEIFRFTYNDKSPWPRGADGTGRSLVLRSSAFDPVAPDHWRSSVATGGTPGGSDSVAFSGTPDADADGDGFTAAFEHAAGTSDAISSPEAQPELTVETFTPGGMHQPFLTLTARRNLAADDTTMTAEFATNFDAWSNDPAEVKFLGEIIGTDGVPRLRWRAVHPFTDSATQFLRLRMTLTLP
ncbi:MAG: lamin tail domain-containing protein, partial [Chthoniobacteraceae bacterium]